ncbi:tetratricopeptide (TPR) repeat protein [Streptomyces sp. LBL]|uniref:hypothetical protein n=1 Tax=Streptomyces sp. LBL TaxID=2940562 RepID=UPI002472FA06|nr:hypothetical protein [Streptomyces sp. LBL]MDH6628705.1 tetratricopeptide (TPR) repeat protein [Streptomyces sp. LBL]
MEQQEVDQFASWERDRYGVPFLTKCAARLRALGRDADAEAVKLLSQGSLTEAETWFRAAAAKEPEIESPSKFMLAEFLARQGRDGEAEGWYRRAALATDGSYDVRPAAEHLGDLLSARRAYEEAETWYCRAYYGDDPPGSTWKPPLGERIRPIDFASRQPGVAHKRAAALLAMGKVAEADAFLAEAEEDQRRNPPAGLAEVVTTAVLTGALVPFLQTMVSKAGEDSYQAARAMIHRWATTLRRSPTPESPPEQAGMEGVVLRISAHVSNEALRQLADLDFAVIRQTMGSAVEVSWDESSHEWKITPVHR